MITLKNASIAFGLIAGSASLTGLIGYSTGLFSSGFEISELITKENKYSLLSENKDSQFWAETWKKYKQDNKGQEKDKWMVNGWKKEGVQEVPNGFKSMCSKRKTNKVYGIKDQEYIDFIKYCARAKTIEEILIESGFSPLKDDGTNAKWKAKINEYKIATDQLPKAILEKEATDDKFEVLKAGCEVSLKLKTIDEDYEKTLLLVKKWCGV